MEQNQTALTAEQQAALAEQMQVAMKEEGGKIFKKLCATCHSVQSGVNRIGPSLYGLFGRTSGSVEGFSYSAANKAKGVVWSEETLFEYLLKPDKYIPGTTMKFVGLKNEDSRRALIAYLKDETKEVPKKEPTEQAS